MALFPKRWRFCLLGMLFATPSLAVVQSVITKPWLRLESGAENLQLNRHATWLAYTLPDGNELRLIELATGRILQVSNQRVGPSFFWGPDGMRLFYREIQPISTTQVESRISAFDTALKKSVPIRTLPDVSGYLTFDPRDLRFQVLHANGILTQKLYFPDQRLAKWQVSKANNRGKWLATQKSMLWVTELGHKMAALKDDGSGVASYHIAPDSSEAAWATNDGFVYRSKLGEEPELVGRGRDPVFHPKKPYLLYAAANMSGPKIVSYDLKIVDAHGSDRFLTRTPLAGERWPQWTADGKTIIYTSEHTTDLFRMEFKL